MKKTLVILGHISFLITAILSIVFYKERALFADSGQLIFEMLNEGKCKVFLGRYSMLISEFIPWIAIKMQLSLKTILIIYSLSFILIYYLCYLICIYGFRNLAAGTSIAFVPLIVRWAFGQSVCESWMAIAYTALFYATINSYQQWKKHGNVAVALFYLLAFVLVGLNYFMHPVTLFTMLFALGFTWIYKKEFSSTYIYIILIAIILPFLIKFILPNHPYEENLLMGIKHPQKILPILFETAIPEFLYKNFFRTYVYIAVPLVVTGFLFVRKGKLWSFIFCIGLTIGFLLITILSFYQGDAPFMLETRLIPLIFFILVPLIEMVKDYKNGLAMGTMFILLLTGSFIGLINSTKQMHTKRINAYIHFLQQAENYPGSKFFVHLPLNKSNPINSWGSAGETLMLSSLKGSLHSKTIIFLTEDMHIEEGINTYPCTFLWLPWRLYANETYLNPRYFNLNCSTYQELTYSENY